MNDTSPNPLPTEFALASDGVLYVHEDSAASADRNVFVGYALLPEETSRLGAGGLLAWALRQKLALGSDGRVYVEAGAVETGDRPCFRGYAATPAETKLLVEELHRMAFNATAALRHEMALSRREN